jgi:hypothetical protein
MFMLCSFPAIYDCIVSFDLCLFHWNVDSLCEFSLCFISLYGDLDDITSRSGTLCDCEIRVSCGCPTWPKLYYHHNITSHHHIIYLCIAGCLLCSFFVRSLKPYQSKVLIEHRIVTVISTTRLLQL